MDLFEKKGVLASLFLLCVGAFGNLVQPFPRNTSVPSGTRNLTLSCTSNLVADMVSWIFTPDGSNETRMIAMGKHRYQDGYDLYFTNNDITSNLVVREAIEATSGVYTCSDGIGEARAHLTITSNSGSSSGRNDIPIITATLLGFLFLIIAIFSIVYRMKRMEVSAMPEDARTVDLEMQSSVPPEDNQIGLPCAVNGETLYAELPIQQIQQHPIQLMDKRDSVYADLGSV